jgi:hypothetical protein
MAAQSLDSLPTDTLLRASITSGTSQQLTLVHRDEGFTAVSPNPREDLKSAGQIVTQTLGPFLDGGGRRIVIDALSTTTFVPVLRMGAAQPFLYLTSARPVPFTGIPNVVQFFLGAGTIWLSAPLFSADAPPSTLAGVQISSGRLIWSGAPFFHPGPAPTSITVPSAVSVTLELALVEQIGRSGANPPSTEFSVHTPQDVTFHISPTSASLQRSDAAKLTVLGDAFTFSLGNSVPHYDDNLKRLQLALQMDKALFQATQNSATLVNVAGSATVIAAAWNLALIPAPLDPTNSDLPQASGAGGLSLSVNAGLLIPSSFYNTSITCGPCSLLAEGSTFVLTGERAVGGRASLSINLSSSSHVTFRPRGPFNFRYINSYDGHESWGTVLPCIATFDRPRTIDNQRLVNVSPNTSLVFLRSTTGTACTILGSRDPDSPAESSFALKNLLVRARVSRFSAIGEFSAVGIVDGTATLGLSISSAVPFLPDPYASNIDPLAGILSEANLDAVIKWQAQKFVSIDLSFPQQQNLKALSLDINPELVAVTPAVTLLDLSTSVSQFGVSFLPHRTANSLSAVKDLYLQMHASSLGVTALPAVQWEPVVTDPNPDNFPSPLRFQNNGPQTLLVSNSVTLTPVAPRQAIDTLLSDYEASPPSAVTARFTLPFGLVAEASLARSLNFLVTSPSLRNIQPGFSAAKLQAGDQISIGASRALILGPPFTQRPSPSIPGKITSPQDTSFNGTSTTQTVLGVLQDTFTTEFTQNPRIPVTRVDISGFGESIVSDWRNPKSLPPSISKVALEVFVGRTAKEVVQAFSILYPYGVPVVRTITIERENSARIVRHDSGWQAAGDGHYIFPVSAGQQPLVTHPGLVTNVVDVRNIRDMISEQVYKITVGADTIELMPVRFDCYARIENTILGATAQGVPANDQLGYVQLTQLPGAGSLTSAQYASLLQDRGPMGGSVDCVTDIGKSGLRARILRIGAGASRRDTSTTDYEIAMAAFGAPLFPKIGGQWSFVMAYQDSGMVQPVDSQKGVPLIRQNSPAGGFPSSPYRFADPKDLLATNPEWTFCLVHSTTSYRLLFPQPRIEASSHQISSTLPLILADPFALSTSTALFPVIAACIPIDDVNWKLEISADTNLKLQLSNSTFTTEPVARILHNNPNIRSIAYTNDDAGKPAVVTLTIDSSAALSWSLNITNLSLAIGNDNMGEISRVVGTIDASAVKPAAFLDPKLVFGPKMAVVASLISFLEYFGPMPPLDVGFGSVSASEVFNLQKFLSSNKTTPVGKWFSNYVTDMDFKIEFLSTEDRFRWGISSDLTFKLPLVQEGPSPIVIFLAKLDISVDDDGTTTEVTIGAGYGYQMELFGNFSAYAYAALTVSVITGNSVFGVGLALILRADIDLDVVEAQVTAEVRGEMIHVSCGLDPMDRALWAVGQFTLAVEITIFAVLDIEFDYQTESRKNTDNGPCPLN